MTITITAVQTLRLLYIFSWIIFVGICIQAGSFIANAFFSLSNPAVVKHLWHEVDLSDLFNYNRGYFFTETLIMSIVAVLKACIFFLVIKLLHDKKLSLSQPFSAKVRRFIFLLAYLSLVIGLFSVYGVRYAEWLTMQGIKMPDAQYLHLGGADVWLFMSVILFVIAYIFKRGIEIQEENELTV